jgi:hypothetical protein
MCGKPQGSIMGPLHFELFNTECFNMLSIGKENDFFNTESFASRHF